MASINSNSILSSAVGTNSSLNSSKLAPRDFLVIQSILKDMGISEYEPRVIYQLLEFTYRYVTNVLDDALIFSQYAKKKNIDSEDIRLAIQLQVERMFTSPPPRDLLLEIARHKNNQPLPPIKSHAGPRLPPDRYSLVGVNYKLKNSAKLKDTQQQSATQIHLPYRTIQTGTTLLTNISGRTPIITLPKQSASPGILTISSSPVVTEIKSVKQISEENQSVKRKASELETDN